ncbi:MAG: leucyl aminopeptidase [Verrucomicrobiales bacterium]|jgi:leucyl aminopeptidase
MKISYKTTTSRLAKTDLLVVFGRAGKKVRLPPGVTVPANAISAFSGTERETRLTDATGGPAERVLQIGLGGEREIQPEIIRRAAAIAVKKAEKTGAASVVFWVDLPLGKHSAELGQALAEGAVMGSYRLSRFQNEAQPAKLKRLAIHSDGAFRKGAKRGEVIGNANCLARRLQDSPANHMRPRDLVSEARKIAGGSSSVSIQVLDEKAMAKLKMGSLLSVSQGSSEPAYLIHLTYKPVKKARRKICLVGKGLTFDSGGISIKPSAKMDEMKYDMSGAAAVLGVFQALSELEPDVEVHGLAPTSENLPDGKAIKPGDVVTASNGKTIEVLNTDAEGRLILADALAYACKKIKPDAMIDLATLTGAVNGVENFLDFLMPSGV